MIPADTRNALLDMQSHEASSPINRYPSRMVFFRRVWHRFHYGENPDGSKANLVEGDETAAADDGGTSTSDALTLQDIPWLRLVSDSPLVTMEDYGLVLDSQFAALSQMDRCKLQQEDQIGYNKGKQVGYVGLCCRYCGGRPNFGRFFPSTERNLEKTSARDTMVSHISLFCKQVPDDVKHALLSLKRIESSKDGSATMKKLIYGSGKLFFHRVWHRLHELEGAGKIEGKSAAESPRNAASKAASTNTVDGPRDAASPIKKGTSSPLPAVTVGLSVLASAKHSILFGKKIAAPQRPSSAPTSVAAEKETVCDEDSVSSSSSSGESVYSDDEDESDEDRELEGINVTTSLKRTVNTAAPYTSKTISTYRLVKKARQV